MKRKKTDIERLFRSHYEKMYHLAKTILYDDAESRDAVSEVFAQLLREPITLLPEGGIYQRQDRRMLGLDFRGTLSWNHLFAEKHIINFFAGMEVNSLKKAYSSFQGWGMQYSMGEIPSYVYQFFKNGIESGSRYYSLGHSETRSIASFLNATYSYDGRYTLNGTFRYEGTNRMGAQPFVTLAAHVELVRCMERA